MDLTSTVQMAPEAPSDIATLTNTPLVRLGADLTRTNTPLDSYQDCANGPWSSQWHGHPAAEDLEGVTAVGREHSRGEVQGSELLPAHDRNDTGNRNKTRLG